MDLTGTTDSPTTQARSTTILGSFLRGRPRNSSQSHIHVPGMDGVRELSPSPPMHHQGQGPPSPIPGTGRRRGGAQAMGVPAPEVAGGQPVGLNQLSHMLRRRRSAGNVSVPAAVPPMPTVVIPAAPGGGGMGTGTSTGTGPAHRIRLVPHLDSRRSLRFDAIARDLRAGDAPLRIGRFTDRSGLGLAAVNALSTNKIAFKSKVVSRAHAEVWVESATDGGQEAAKFFIRDTKSSSGTFLNHVRLSAANAESRPHQVKDGDILQLGVDYQGGAEDIYKSVKIRVEIGREWQSAANAFNTTALKNLKALAITPDGAQQQTKSKRKSLAGASIPDCCICLFPVSIRQALFIAPCSHAFHYKCLRPLLEAHHPAFSCPLCRTFADLEEDVEVEEPEAEEEYEELIPDAAGTFPVSALAAHGEGVLAGDLADEDGDEVDELFAPPRIRLDGGGGGMETEVEDNVNPGTSSAAMMSRSRNASAQAMEGDLPPLPDADDVDVVEMEVDADVDSGEGSSGDVMAGATLGGKRKR